MRFETAEEYERREDWIIQAEATLRVQLFLSSIRERKRFEYGLGFAEPALRKEKKR